MLDERPGPPPPEADVQVFRSRWHPGDASTQFTFARSLVQPLATCLLPVMILMLLEVLQGASIWTYLTLAFPGAAGVATLWTLFRLQRAPAEVAVREGEAALRTIWEVTRRTPRTWHPVFDTRDYRTWLLVTVGLASYELERADWPAYDQLREALRLVRV